MKLQPLHEYYAALMGADFDWENSDDPGWYRRAKAVHDDLLAQARASDQHRALFDQFRARNGNANVPLPERPVAAEVV